MFYFIARAGGFRVKKRNYLLSKKFYLKRTRGCAEHKKAEKYMNLYKKLSVCILMIFCSMYAFSENILFCCVLNEDATENATEITIRFEDYIFSSCFELGLIAGNAPSIRDSRDTSEIITSLEKVSENPSEYILIIKAHYNKDASVDQRTQEKFAQLAKVSYTLFSVITSETVFTKNVTFSTSKTKSDLLKQIEKVNTNVMKTVAKKIN